jgi:monoamine oxidase
MSSGTSPITTDVIVIGAGAAGLAAADALVQAGKQVLLLEARDRIGGRIWTRREAHLGAPIELGAEFIHGRAPQTRSVLERAGVATIDTAHGRWLWRAGELTQGDDWFGSVVAAMAKSDVLAHSDMSFDEFIERHLSQELSSEARAGARRMAEGFDAADTARASARAIVNEWTGDSLGDAPQSRPEGGYDALLAALMARMDARHLRLQLQSVVSGVQWSPGSVRVRGQCRGEGFEVHAPQAIVTLPLGVLQYRGSDAAAVTFSPELQAKRAALEKLASGSVVKVLLRFATPFWQTLHGGRYRDASFFIAPGTELATLWTPAPLSAPLLVAWLGGPRALRLAGLSAGEIVRQVLAAVQTFFGTEIDVASELEGYYYHDWQHDPCARGAYSYVLVGGSGARAALAAPLAATLYFAGEATDTQDESGTVDGALASGVRAARELLQSP